ncbi:MAG: hypothetical protein WD426_17095 [Anditalea sp.]
MSKTKQGWRNKDCKEEHVAKYATIIQSRDAGLGAVMKKLNELG